MSLRKEVVTPSAATRPATLGEGKLPAPHGAPLWGSAPAPTWSGLERFEAGRGKAVPGSDLRGGNREPASVGAGEGPAELGLDDSAAYKEGAKRGEEVGLADTQRVAQQAGRLWTSRHDREPVEYARLERVGRVFEGAWWRVEDGEVGKFAGHEAQAKRRRRRRTTMLGDEEAVVAATGEIEGGVGPGREVAGAAELLGRMSGGRLAHVVDENDGDGVLALQRA